MNQSCPICGHQNSIQNATVVVCSNCGSVFHTPPPGNSLPDNQPPMPVSKKRPWKNYRLAVPLIMVVLAVVPVAGYYIKNHSPEVTNIQPTIITPADETIDQQLYEKAVSLYKQGKYKEAKAKLQKINKQFSGYPNVTKLLKQIEYKLKQAAAAKPKAASSNNLPAVSSPNILCKVTKVPVALGLDSFYQKYCAVRGLPIVAAGVVSGEAMEAAAKIIDLMGAKRPDVITKLAAKHVRYGIIGKNQQVLDMPEYKDLYDPDYDWNARSRVFGATEFRPLSSSAEENLLCLTNDRYAGESITVHEFSHTFLNMGLEFIDSGFKIRLAAAFNAAKTAGKWVKTYAGSNVEEYWAEGVQSYFDTNIQSTPPNGIHNYVNTRSELKAYDLKLYNLIAEVFTDSTAKATCQ